jgi:tetratricopeptide (TPR) repeat protein
LAASLNNLSVRLADLGRREEALAAIEEAVAAHRSLAPGRPDAFLPDLASSLNNFSNNLSDLGRRQEAAGRFAEILKEQIANEWATGVLLLSRARWQHRGGELAEAMTDAREATRLLEWQETPSAGARRDPCSDRCERRTR